MKKPVFAMLLGGVLGVFDGLSALISAPQEAPNILGIVIGSTVKGVVAGLIIGLVAQRTRSMAVGVLTRRGRWRGARLSRHDRRPISLGNRPSRFGGRADRRHRDDEVPESVGPGAQPHEIPGGHVRREAQRGGGDGRAVEGEPSAGAAAPCACHQRERSDREQGNRPRSDEGQPRPGVHDTPFAGRAHADPSKANTATGIRHKASLIVQKPGEGRACGVAPAQPEQPARARAAARSAASPTSRARADGAADHLDHASAPSSRRGSHRRAAPFGLPRRS